MQKAINFSFLTFFLLTVILSCSFANVELPAIFSDNMVLQQNQKLSIWGKAGPGEAIEIGFDNYSRIWAVTADDDGNWETKIGPFKGSFDPLVLTVKGNNTVVVKNVLVGEVWLASGQSNMEMRLGGQGGWETGVLGWEKELEQADNPGLRLYTVKKVADNIPHEDCQGYWQQSSSDSVKDFSAVAYFFAQKLQKELNIPVGIINCSWSGTGAQAWMSEDMLRSDDDFKEALERYKADYADYQRLMVDRDRVIEKWKKACEKAKVEGKEAPEEPRWMPPYATGCYNGMILPMSKYTMKGFIWYQGEGNTWGGYLYRKLFATMIDGWREIWGQGDMPFYFVQLANFQAYSSKEAFQSTWAELRDSQFHVLKAVKNTGMAVTIDVGEPDNVHPREKKAVGHRLALWALAKDYNKKIPYSGPIYKSMKKKDSAIILKFDHVGKGLICKGERLTGFAIAGEDKKFVEAEAKIKGRTLVVSSDKVKKPIAVRYGWQDSPTCNLYNLANLPASPFRTDNFPAITANNK